MTFGGSPPDNLTLRDVAGAVIAEQARPMDDPHSVHPGLGPGKVERVSDVRRLITARSQLRSHLPLLKTLVFTDPTVHLTSTLGTVHGVRENPGARDPP